MPNLRQSAKEEDSRAKLKVVKAILLMKGVFTAGTYTTTDQIAISRRRTRPMVSSENNATLMLPGVSPGVSAGDAAENEVCFFVPSTITSR